MIMLQVQLVLNNFESEDKASHLMSTVLQNMLPSLNVHTVSWIPYVHLNTKVFTSLWITIVM